MGEAELPWCSGRDAGPWKVRRCSRGRAARADGTREACNPVLRHLQLLREGIRLMSSKPPLPSSHCCSDGQWPQSSLTRAMTCDSLLQMRTVRGPFLVASLFALLGCGASVSQLRSRASFDLDCPAQQLRITEIDARTRGVRGCGQRVTYIESCSDSRRARNTCTWVLNRD